MLDLLREKVVKELGQKDKEGSSKDGMDISLARFNLQTKEFQWAGANNPLYIIQKGIAMEIKGNKQPIGYHSNMHPFTNHVLQLEKGDCIYLFTDGFADQFGGPSGKKYKYSQQKQLLFSVYKNSMQTQKEILASSFEKWKSELEQTDDLRFIGVKI